MSPTLPTLVVTHGRDQPFEVPGNEGLEWENSLRFGLERVDAPYAKTIPYTFAFYGVVWRDALEQRAGERALGGGPVQTRALQIELARELATTAGLKPPDQAPEGEKDFWDMLAATVRLVGNHLGVQEAILKNFLADLAQYLSNNRLRNLVLDRIQHVILEAGGDVVLLGHSMGSIVSYDLVKRHPDLPVVGLVTFGSPMGLEGIRQHVGDAPGTTPFPPRLPCWINIYNREDIATLIPKLAPFFPSTDGRVIDDREAVGAPPSVTDLARGHEPKVYLSSLTMGQAVRSIVDNWQAAHPA